MMLRIVSALALCLCAAPAAAQDTVTFGDWRVICERPAVRASCRIEQSADVRTSARIVATVTFNIDGDPEFGIRLPAVSKRSGPGAILLGTDRQQVSVMGIDCHGYCDTSFRLNKTWISRLYPHQKLWGEYAGNAGTEWFSFSVNGLEEAIRFVSERKNSALMRPVPDGPAAAFLPDFPK